VTIACLEPLTAGLMASVVVLSSVAIILVWILFRRRRTTKQRLVVVDEEQDSSSSLRTRLSPLHSDVFYNDDKSGFTTGSSHVTEGPARVSGVSQNIVHPHNVLCLTFCDVCQCQREDLQWRTGSSNRLWLCKPIGPISSGATINSGGPCTYI